MSNITLLFSCLIDIELSWRLISFDTWNEMKYTSTNIDIQEFLCIICKWNENFFLAEISKKYYIVVEFVADETDL